MTDDYADMRPEPVDSTPHIRGLLDRMKSAREAVQVLLTVHGKPVSAHDCDWVLARPCGCVYTIAHAYAFGELLATEEDAWHALYDADPHPHRRVRDVAIRRRKAEGWTLRVETIDDAVRMFRQKPDHDHPETKGHDD